MENQKNDLEDRHIVTLTVQELQKAISSHVLMEVNSFIENFSGNNLEDTDEVLLTRFEVAKLFKISTVSLDKWKKAKILPEPVKIAGKVYYMKKEIMLLIEKSQRKQYGK